MKKLIYILLLASLGASGQIGKSNVGQPYGTYVTATFPGASIPSGWASTAGAATITYSTGLHISGGSGFYVNNNVRSTSVSSSNNYTQSIDFNVVTKPTDNIGGLWFGRVGSSSNATHLYVAFKRSDATHAYATMRVVNGNGNGSTFDSTSTIALADGNNYRMTLSQSQNTIYFRLAQLSSGVEVTGNIVDKLYTIATNTAFQLPSMGVIGIGSLGGSYVVTPATETLRDVLHPDVLMIGTSITQGYMPSVGQNHYLPLAFKDSKKTWVNFGSGGSLCADAASLLPEIYLLSPVNVGIELAVNDVYTAVRPYLPDLIDSLQAHGITPFILKDFTVANKDSVLYNIAKEQGIKIIDPGAFMTAGYFVDGVHPNDLGNAFIAKYCKSFGPEFFGTIGGIDQYTLRGLRDIKLTSPASGDGLFYNSTTAQFENGTGSGSFIKNQIASQQSGNLWINGYAEIDGSIGVGMAPQAGYALSHTINSTDGSGLYFKNNNSSAAVKYTQLFQSGTNGYGIGDWLNNFVIQAGNGLVLNSYDGSTYFQTNNSSQTRMIISKFGQIQMGYPAIGTLCTACAFEVQTTIATSKPFPAMTTSQRNAIASVQAGDGVYCSDCTASDASTGVAQIWNGSAWKNFW